MVILWGDVTEACRAALPCPVLSFDEVLQRGGRDAADFAVVAPKPESLATLVYTSGTTGRPKAPHPPNFNTPVRMCGGICSHVLCGSGATHFWSHSLAGKMLCCVHGTAYCVHGLRIGYLRLSLVQ